ncbi:MAG: hypothetical protein PWR29_1851 [Methanolobus sp.]|jgi:hypothetical protein|nr:hypothetical protein [Methanolobus sp.]MDK2833990.1 hypothetical protein [Methanolobus sp.]MDK2912894.1 hypothetical protein [Methanolobus sp.]MDN5309170.1 hypothetical protein [Methanolobus sp.]
MTTFDIDQKELVKNSVLIPVAFVAGTLIAILAYSYLPQEIALLSVISGAVLISLITYALVRTRSN